nr:histone-lysine N-methyltransferase [Tanacetum cinerariifolium]
VHTRCYGELKLVDGVLWLRNLCHPGAPEVSPPCCLCPVTGGAMKPTTDKHWANLACAMWILETCLSDIKKMEPVDGMSRISKVITSIRLHFTPPY